MLSFRQRNARFLCYFCQKARDCSRKFVILQLLKSCWKRRTKASSLRKTNVSGFTNWINGPRLEMVPLFLKGTSMVKLCVPNTNWYAHIRHEGAVPYKDSYDEQWWQHHAASHSVESWQGLTFELLCLMHIRQIRQALNIGGVATEVSAWFDQADKKKAVRGSQIDLIIERADRIIHLCEMKFSQGEYRITADYEEKLRNRMVLFKEKTKNKMTLVHTFVTTFGVANGKHSSLVHSEVTLDGLFIA